MARFGCFKRTIALSGLALGSCTPPAEPPNTPPSPPVNPTPTPEATTPQPAPTPPPVSSQPPPPVANKSLEKRHFPEKFGSELPFDIDIPRVGYLDSLVGPIQPGNADPKPLRAAQREFDIFSWESFLALNWPVGADGKPAGKFTDNPTAQRAWSTWRSGESIFLPDGGDPKPWTGLPSELSLFRAKGAWRAHTSADQNFQAFTGPLVDQNGNWVRYEVFVNAEEFAYLLGNKLYNLEGQIAYTQRSPAQCRALKLADDCNAVVFPVNEGTRHGATEIKLAWKVLGPKDDRSRMFVAKVKVRTAEFLPPGQTKPPEPVAVEAGLVGMHIAVRTQSSPEWIWATFEQVDNTRVNKTADGKTIKPNFFDPAKPSGPKDVNILAPKNAALDPITGIPVKPSAKNPASTWVESLTKTPTQVKRIDVPTQGALNQFDKVLADDVAELNAEVQAKLRSLGSVFQYYELIGTQWPVHPNAPAFAGGAKTAPESIAHKTPGDVVPVFLVNTTMETFFMAGPQKAGPLEQDDRLAPNAPPIDDTEVIGTESCVGCHYSSGVCIGFKKNMDGTDALDPATGKKIPVFGENSHFGKTGNANFSWLLQIEARSTQAPAPRTAAGFLDIGAALRPAAAATKAAPPKELGKQEMKAAPPKTAPAAPAAPAAKPAKK